MEKIKTVGDAFMATAGLLCDLPEPVLAGVLCGFEMIEATKQCKPDWQVRVGIHQGPVVAGVIGRSQFLYDLWGGTVTTAARIPAWDAAATVVLSAWRGRAAGRDRGGQKRYRPGVAVRI